MEKDCVTLHTLFYFSIIFNFLALFSNVHFFQVHPVRVDREPKIKKESEADFLKHTNTFLPNKYDEHGNLTVFEKVILI